MRSILNYSSSKTSFSSFNQKPPLSSLIELHHHRLRLTMAEICRRHLGTAAKRLVSRLGVSSSFSQSRSFGAAAVQVQYDDEDEYDEMYEDRKSQMIVPREESTDSILGRGVHWVFMGNPSAMKRVYAEKLSKILQVPHISMGSLVRQELNPHSSLYKQIANSVNQGKLVTEDIIFGLLSKRLEEGHSKGETGFILNGIPRTILQAEILDEITDIDLVVNFKCTGDCSAKKHMGSGICSYCQECLGKGNSVSSSLNLQLKNTQLNHSNTDEARKEKLRIYSEQRKPLEDYYRRQKKILDFQVASAPGETWQGLLSALHLKHVNAIHSSHELIA